MDISEMTHTFNSRTQIKNSQSSQGDWLTREFSARSKRTHGYSLRSFADALGISSGSLSEVMNGKRMLGRTVASRVATNMGLSPDQTNSFILGDSLASSLKEKRREKKTADPLSDADFRELSEDQFRIVSDWEHFAILSLAKTADFRHDPHWVASRLGITHFTAKAAMHRIIRLGLMKLVDGRLIRTSARLTTTRDIPSAAIRQAHRQTLEQAIEALESVSVDKRDFSGITFAVDSTRLPEIKERIRSFRRSILDEFSTGNLREVYNLNIQLVPVTKGRSS